MFNNSPPRDPQITAAVSLLREGRKSQALQILKSAAVGHPENPEVWLLLHLAQDDAHMKRICLEKALELDPTNTFAQTELARLSTTPSWFTVAAKRISTGRAAILPDYTSDDSQDAILIPRPHFPQAPARGAYISPLKRLGISQAEAAILAVLLALAAGLLVIIAVSIVGPSLFPAPSQPAPGPIALPPAQPGALRGTISWSTLGAGNVLVQGVTVRVWDRSGDVVLRSAITNSDGAYDIGDLDPGTYLVSVYQPASLVGDLIAEKCWVFRNVAVRAGETTPLYMDISNTLDALDPLCTRGLD